MGLTRSASKSVLPRANVSPGTNYAESETTCERRRAIIDGRAARRIPEWLARPRPKRERRLHPRRPYGRPPRSRIHEVRTRRRSWRQPPVRLHPPRSSAGPGCDRTRRTRVAGTVPSERRERFTQFVASGQRRRKRATIRVTIRGGGWRVGKDPSSMSSRSGKQFEKVDGNEDR